MLKTNLLNKIFILEMVLFGLIVTGILPRAVVPYLAIALAAYVLWVSLEDATLFFIRSIPFFLAIPLTATFDNFNTWRLLAVIIFLKWLWPQIFNFQFSIFNKFSIYQFLKQFKLHTILLIILLLLTVLSIIPALDKIAAVKRIIFFLNFAILGIVIYHKATGKEFAKRLIKNLVIPVVIVAIVGYIQVISTYFIDIYQFMRLWGEDIQCNQFGNQWCNIAVQVGNTWFAYYGEQLSLRVFSLFPDSHSFPQFVLLGLPAIFALALSRFGINDFENLKKMYQTRTQLIIVMVPIVFLIAILSGTRGIWAASAGVLVVIMTVIVWMKKSGIDTKHRNIFKYLTGYMAVFFLLFSIAYPIFVSPQFLLSKGDWGLFGSRIKSIIDFGETSNAQRIEIWKKTVVSIKNHPLLGVGIGNFPVVLGQDLSLAKAGSSAHNVYLQIAAEMGISALIFALWFLWLLMQKTYTNFISSKDWKITIYNGAALIFIPWVLIYCLTDVALFDERAFLLFVATVSLILATKNPNQVGH